MSSVAVIQGDGAGSGQRPNDGGARRAVRCAQEAGFHVGCRVHLGQVAGRVVGYNIARSGVYFGGLFPLLVETELGIAKCSLLEVSRD